MQTAQGNSTVLECHATDKGAVGEESNVHSGESQECMHDVGRSSSDPQQTIQVTS